MFKAYNYFRQYNNNEEIKDYKEFYKKFSNEKEFGSANFQHFDHLIKNRFMDIFGHLSNVVLRKMPESILDIGCGAGINLPLSKTYDFIKYYGVDYADKTLTHARQLYPNIDFSVMDAFNLSFEDKKFDMAIIASVLVLYEKLEDRLVILQNAQRVLKDDGVLVVIVWNETFLLKYSILLSRIIARIKNIPLPEDFLALYFKESEAINMFNKANFSVQQVIHTSSLYGALECTRYLNMSKYRRVFGKAEGEHGTEKEQNILMDLQKSSNSKTLISFFYYLSKLCPKWLAMFSIYILKKEQ